MGRNQRLRKRTFRQILILLVMLCGLFIAWKGYLSWHDSGKFIQAHFKKQNGATSANFNLEVVADEASRQKGLMFRKTLPPNQGMLFVFPEETVQSFWMKNTYIPLDMIFLNRDSKVVGLLKDIPILNDTARSVPQPSKYVVELLAGTAAKEGIDVGAELVVEGKGF